MQAYYLPKHDAPQQPFLIERTGLQIKLALMQVAFSYARVR